MRLLVNNTLDCDQVRDVKELVDDYVERNTEPDFEEVEIYEDLHLDVAELSMLNSLTRGSEDKDRE